MLCPLFILGGLSDWLDGYLARLLNQQTPWGAFLDQFADKVMVSTALIILVALHQNSLIILAAILSINRELAMASLRQLAAEKNVGGSVKVNNLGKIKTALQLIGIGVLLAYPVWIKVQSLYLFGIAMLVAATLFAWISFFSYYAQFSIKLK